LYPHVKFSQIQKVSWITAAVIGPLAFKYYKKPIVFSQLSLNSEIKRLDNLAVLVVVVLSPVVYPFEQPTKFAKFKCKLFNGW